MQISNDESTGAGASDGPRLAEVGARAESRLVRRDERTRQGKPLASGESSVSDFVKDYDAEIYRLESRGGKGAVVGYPVPLESARANLAHIDWCAFTLRASGGRTERWVMSELQRLGGFEQFTPRKFGMYGYEASAIIEEGGLMAWGGKNQKGTVYVSLNAQGCARITDWEKLRAWCECHQAKLTRVDFAHDDFAGGTVNIEWAHQTWLDNGFNTGGRRPEAKLYGDWWGLTKGRSVYMGERQNGKLLRVYEKGKQLGDPDSPWVRVELELHSKDRVIPLDAVTRAGAYLAGAYPCLHFLSAEQNKLRTTGKAVKIAYRRAKEVLKQQGGKLIGVMLKVEGGDYAAVVNALKRDGVPSRLDPYSYHIRTNDELLQGLEGGGDSNAVVPT